MLHRSFPFAAALVFIALQSFVPARAAGPARYSWRVVAGARPAPLFYQGAGIAIAPDGTVVIADSGDHRVERFSSAGTLLSSWGTDAPGRLHLSGPRAVAVDQAGNLYLADNGVLKLSSTGRFLARWSGGVLSYPRGLAVDTSGDLYVLSLHPVPFSPSFNTITITKLSPTGKRLATLVYRYPEPAGDAALGAAIAVAPDGNLLLSIKGQHHCHSCDGTYYLLRTISPAGATLSQVPETAGGSSISVDAAGTIYLAEPHAVQELSPVGALRATFGASGCGPGQLGADLELATSPAGILYVADSQIPAIRPDGIPVPYRSGVLHRFTSDSVAQPLLGACPVPGARTTFGQINGLAAGPGGTLYLADGITSVVYRVVAGGEPVSVISANHPSTVTTDRAGNIYVPDLQRDALVKYSPAGTQLAATSGTVIEAAAIARNGQVYALTAFGEVVVLPSVGRGTRPLRRWWLQGYSRGQGGLDPEGIALDGLGNIWVADIRHNNIQEYTPSGRLLRIWGREGTAPGRFHNPNALTVDGRGHLFVADGNNNRLQEFDLHGHFLAAFGRDGQAPGQFLGPRGIAADAAGNIYVGDRGNNRIQELVRH